MTDMSEAARAMGRAKTPKKAASSAANGKLGGRPAPALENVPCTCGCDPHKWACKRRQTEYYRERSRRYRAKKTGAGKEEKPAPA